MFALQAAAAQGIDSIRLLIVVFVIFAVAFWRVMLQIVIVVTVSVVLIGVVVLLSDLVHLSG